MGGLAAIACSMWRDLNRRALAHREQAFQAAAQLDLLDESGEYVSQRPPPECIQLANVDRCQESPLQAGGVHWHGLLLPRSRRWVAAHVEGGCSSVNAADNPDKSNPSSQAGSTSATSQRGLASEPRRCRGVHSKTRRGEI